ncbi:MAG: TerB family tellurite resistance protein [Rhodospirillales bacterium]|nr:TerB family tellurite resistance protein [Rhodospirillales bacterium]
MLQHILNLFSPGQAGTPKHAKHEMQIAAGALLIEAAMLDGHFDDRERAAIERVLRERFDLSPAETADLVAAAEAKVSDSTQLFEFTRVIARHFSEEERIRLVEMLCEVMYADGALHDYEASLFRKIGELIHVSDRDRGDARKRVLARLGRE